MIDDQKIKTQVGSDMLKSSFLEKGLTTKYYVSILIITVI